MTYLITFACYGCHLHGSESGSVDHEHYVQGTGHAWRLSTLSAAIQYVLEAQVMPSVFESSYFSRMSGIRSLTVAALFGSRFLKV